MIFGTSAIFLQNKCLGWIFDQIVNKQQTAKIKAAEENSEKKYLILFLIYLGINCLGDEGK